jgi:hypothetical protein
MIILTAVVLVPPTARGQQLSDRSSLVVRGTVVTSSRVFDNPDSPVSTDRDHFDFVDNLLGGGLEYRLAFPDEGLFLTLSAEYVSKVSSTNQSILVNNVVRQFPVEQGVRFIPVEFGVHTGVPIISDLLTLTMGGGLGAYYADRVFGIAGVRMKSRKFPAGYGIHIESAFDYRLSRNLQLSFEMRFRDPEVINESGFDTDVITVDNYQIPVGNISPKTKVNVHGVSFTIGIVFGLGS